jgi:hypothetical protein
MKLEPMLAALESLAEQLEVAVKYEPLATSVGSGGLCKVNGEYRVIIDKRATTAERVATLARSLGKLDISAAAIPPEVRSTILRYAERGI